MSNWPQLIFVAAIVTTLTTSQVGCGGKTTDAVPDSENIDGSADEDTNSNGDSGGNSDSESDGESESESESNIASDECLPLGDIPDPVFATITINKSCPIFDSCEGTLQDGTLELESMCLNASSLMTEVFNACNDASIFDVRTNSLTGRVTLKDQELRQELAANVDVELDFPNACHECRCDDLEAQLITAGASAQCDGTCSNGNCRCRVNIEWAIDQNEKFTVDGATITTESGDTFATCVDGGRLSLSKTSSDGALRNLVVRPAEDFVTPEICDGLDNDGNDVADDHPLDCPSCSNLGVCSGSFDAKCNGTSGWQCVYTSPEYEEEETLCDCLDNDCDGIVDEELNCPGLCEECASIPEICDGLDNNCSGEADEGNPGGGQSCVTGQLGVCAAGTLQCVSGSIQCLQNTLPDVEICDGLDNNCDGKTDEGDPEGGAQCYTGQPGVCQYGIIHCLLGDLECQAINSPKPEVCNGVDDDCNTTIDDPGSVNGLPCDTGTPGLCAKGATLCVQGTEICNNTTFPQTEICDGQDNNCNGSTDEMNPDIACATEHPSAQSVSAWGCANGTCEIKACSAGSFNVNTSIGDGCECNLSTLGETCSSALSISVPLNTPLNSPTTRTAGIPTANGSGWMRVSFAKPSIGTPYHFRITLTDSHGSEYRMNVRTTCSNYAVCTAGMTTETGEDVTTWEASTSYGSQPQDSPAPPSQIYVQIYRPTPQLSCNTFEVSVYNY